MGKSQKNTPVDIQVRIDKLLDGDSSTKAFASATIGNAFAVHDIRITEKDDKVMVNMPFRSYKANGETKYVDTFHPITTEAHNQLYDAFGNWSPSFTYIFSIYASNGEAMIFFIFMAS